MDLPDSVLEHQIFAPVEDVVLTILRTRLPDLDVRSLIEDEESPPSVIVRRSPEAVDWSGDPRFVDSAYVDIETFASGIDADDDAARISEAVRVALYQAWREGDYYPGLGSLSYFDQRIAPTRRPDWATGVGPVQYADLPAGFVRYESTHYIEIRRPRH